MTENPSNNENEFQQNHTNISTTMSNKDYYYGVYPLASCYPKCWFKCVDFFYPSVPDSIVKDVGGPPPNPEDSNYAPPPINSPWIPIWYPPGAFAINRYPPSCWWNYPNLKKVPSNGKLIQVTHVPDDQDFYTVQGTWFYAAKGSGIYLNLGKTLIARNKIDALNQLKVGAEELAGLYHDGNYMINEGLPYISFSTLAEELYPQISDPIERLAVLFSDAANIPLLAKNDIPIFKLYNIDRINNSSDFDQLICQLARAVGYDTVQFVTQANGNGGWSWEIVFVNQPLFLKTDAIRMTYVLPRIYIVDPCNYCKHEHCDFDPFKKYTCLYCSQQTSNILCRYPPTATGLPRKYPPAPNNPPDNLIQLPNFPSLSLPCSNPPKYPPNCCSYSPNRCKYPPKPPCK